MKCHSINRGTPKRYRVLCKCRYFALNTLSGTKNIRILTPKRYDEHTHPFYMGVPPPPGQSDGHNTSIKLER